MKKIVLFLLVCVVGFFFNGITNVKSSECAMIDRVGEKSVENNSNNDPLTGVPCSSVVKKGNYVYFTLVEYGGKYCPNLYRYDIKKKKVKLLISINDYDTEGYRDYYLSGIIVDGKYIYSKLNLSSDEYENDESVRYNGKSVIYKANIDGKDNKKIIDETIYTNSLSDTLWLINSRLFFGREEEERLKWYSTDLNGEEEEYFEAYPYWVERMQGAPCKSFKIMDNGNEYLVEGKRKYILYHTKKQVLKCGKNIIVKAKNTSEKIDVLGVHKGNLIIGLSKKISKNKRQYKWIYSNYKGKKKKQLLKTVYYYTNT